MLQAGSQLLWPAHWIRIHGLQDIRATRFPSQPAACKNYHTVRLDVFVRPVRLGGALPFTDKPKAPLLAGLSILGRTKSTFSYYIVAEYVYKSLRSKTTSGHYSSLTDARFQVQ